MQPGVERRGAGRGEEEEGAQCHPQGTWSGPVLFCTALLRIQKETGKQKERVATLKQHCVHRPEDGGKKAGGQREEAQPGGGTGPSPKA